MNLSDYLEVFVPTHIINANTDPYIENKMIESTIISCHDTLKLENVKFLISPDARFKKSHPDLMVKYEKYLKEMSDKLQKLGINCELKENNGETLRGNWKQFIENCKKPYVFFLEHDWKFLRYVDVKQIIRDLEKEKDVNYLKLPRFHLTEKYYNSLCSPSNWDWLFLESNKDIKTPMTSISFFSGNPHFARVSFCKDFILPALEKYCPLERSKGASHLEKDIKKAEMYMIDEMRNCGFSNKSTDPEKSWGHQWPLSADKHSGKGCPSCEKAIFEQHKKWGNFMYGKKNQLPVIDHLGDWCAKK